MRVILWHFLEYISDLFHAIAGETHSCHSASEGQTQILQYPLGKSAFTHHLFTSHINTLFRTTPMAVFLYFTRELRETYLTLRTGIYGLIKFVRNTRLISEKLRAKETYTWIVSSSLIGATTFGGVWPAVSSYQE